MGDKILKKLFFLLMFIILTAYAAIESKNGINIDTSVQKYDKIFEDIAQKRVGLSDSEIDKIAKPFVNQTTLRVIKDKNATVSEPKQIVLKLYGIFNKKANINKKWYKIGSKVYGYKLISIKNCSIILKRKKKGLELFLRKKDDNIKITKAF